MEEDQEEREANRAKTEAWLAAYYEPAVDKSAFNCPHCGAYAHQVAGAAYCKSGTGYSNVEGSSTYRFTVCVRCHKAALWNSRELAYPSRRRTGPPPHPDTPDDVKDDYIEAQEIVERSLRGACALLRLCMQKLMVDLGEKGEHINTDIAALVGKGLPIEVQQALDSLRVIGNNALHPGEMDLTDDRDTALALFGVLNFIVEQRIAQPRKLREIYGNLPQGARDAIDRRDASARGS